MKITVTDNKEVRSVAKDSSATHKHVQPSTTLSRKYVHRPTPVVKAEEPKAQKEAKKVEEKKAETVSHAIQTHKRATAQVATEKSAAISRYAKPSIEEAAIFAQSRPVVTSEKAKAEPVVESHKIIASTPIAQAKAAAKPGTKKLSDKEASRQAKLDLKRAKQTAKAEKRISKKSKLSKKERDIKSALRGVDSLADLDLSSKTKQKRSHHKLIIATACSAIIIGILGAFVYFKMPGVSVQMVAARTGIDAVYPSYIPRNYSMDTVYTDKDGTITMRFNNSESSATFTLTEENSTWDSTALLNNYVKKNFRDDYSTIRENGITIYNDGVNSTWVNGGILFKVQSLGTLLTKEQIRNLATSM